jgi:hypothetical protein
MTYPRQWVIRSKYAGRKLQRKIYVAVIVMIAIDLLMFRIMLVAKILSHYGRHEQLICSFKLEKAVSAG